MERTQLTPSTMGWIALGVALFFGSFGPLGGLYLALYIVTFTAGGMVMLYFIGKTKAEELRKVLHGKPLPKPSAGVQRLVSEVRQERPKWKYDKRMTGSNIIDEVLNEVLDYTYRDYIHSWYKKISDDQEFRYDIRQTIQRVFVAFSEKSKQVDLVPYFTTRLVDDFASHIRLYRRALDKVSLHSIDDTKPPPDLESIFFDLEFEMEKHVCRDHICMSDENEIQYLQDLSEVLMFLLLPPEDFHNKPFRYIIREVLVNGVFRPAISLFSDPDYINQTITWINKEATFSSETFLTVLKTSDNTEELEAIKLKAEQDVARQRAKDTGGEDDTFIKQQLSSLLFVKDLCEKRIQRLNTGMDESDSVGVDLNKLMNPGQKLYSLPFDVVLHNNVALAFFIEYMSNIGAHAYLFFYLTVEGYKVSAEQQISAALLQRGPSSEKPDLDMLREAALGIYEQYLSEKASPRLNIDEDKIHQLLNQIKYGDPTDTIFDDVQARVFDMLQEDCFFPAFKRSQLYIKLLAELDLLKEDSKSDDSLNMDEVDQDSISVISSASSLQTSVEDLASSCGSSSSQESLKQYYTLAAQITNTGICREFGKAYAVYMITVTKITADGTEDVWDVYRRYSDFYDLHMTIKDRYDSLSGLCLPSKKAFNNMSKEFLEKRRVALNAYLQTLVNSTVLNNHQGLLELVYNFLEHVVWEKEKVPLSKKMDTIVNPLRNSVKNVGNMVKSVPDNFVDGMIKFSGGVKGLPGNVIDGVGKMLNVKGGNARAIGKNDLYDSAKVGAALDIEDDDNIPLRILMLLMDEVFDLKSKNQWLRRRIVAILRQIIKATFGDTIKRKIVDHVEWLTSSEQIAEYVKQFRDSFWPNGVLAEPRSGRDHNTKMKTRLVCKSKMLGGISDEMRHMIGSETTRKGILRVFNMFQHPRLNRRLVYVILEGVLETIFPDNQFMELFQKMHSKSVRVQKDHLDKRKPKR